MHTAKGQRLLCSSLLIPKAVLQACISRHKQTPTFWHVCKHACTPQTHTHMHIHTHACTHTRMHTHTQMHLFVYRYQDLTLLIPNAAADPPANAQSCHSMEVRVFRVGVCDTKFCVHRLGVCRMCKTVTIQHGSQLAQGGSPVTVAAWPFADLCSTFGKLSP